MRKIIFLLLISTTLFANDLTIRVGSKTHIYSAQKLLKEFDSKEMYLYQNTYGKPMNFTVIPLHQLLSKHYQKGYSMIKYRCLDGFNSTLNLDLVMNKNNSKSVAYLAIETPQNPWPILKKINASPGPFYIVWENPRASNIAKEQWPFQVVNLSFEKSFQDLYSTIIPKTAKNSPEYKGFKVFKDNCFACHKINRVGDSDMGPDLNLPMNPIEYFKPLALKKLIRDPKSVRTWEDSKMSGFDKDAISDQSLENLIEYLRYMSVRKAKR